MFFSSRNSSATRLPAFVLQKARRVPRENVTDPAHQSTSGSVQKDNKVDGSISKAWGICQKIMQLSIGLSNLSLQQISKPPKKKRLEFGCQGHGIRCLPCIHIYCNEWHCGIPSFRFAEEFYDLQPKWTRCSSLAKDAKNCSSVSSTSSACASKAANDHFQST